MSEILLTVAKVRRAMPRNVEVMIVCDALEGALNDMAKLEQALIKAETDAAMVDVRKRFDRKAYQRQYMRKWRAKKKA
jgi:hypothetical protein